MVFIYRGVLAILLFTRGLEGALNIHYRLIEEFVARVYDHIYVHCDSPLNDLGTRTSCTSLYDILCSSTMTSTLHDSVNLGDPYATSLTTYLFGEPSAEKEFLEYFANTLGSHLQWLINHVATFEDWVQESSSTKSAFAANTEITTTTRNINDKNILAPGTFLEQLKTAFALKAHSFVINATFPLSRRHAARFTQNKEDGSDYHHYSKVQHNHVEHNGSQVTISSAVINAPRDHWGWLPEFHGSNESNISVRWVGDWKVMSLPTTIKDGQHTNNSLSVPGCVELKGTYHAILFSKAVVATRLDSTLFLDHPFNDSTRNFILFIEGITWKRAATNDNAIFTLDMVTQLKSHQYNRVWSAKTRLSRKAYPSHVNLLHHITRGFQYGRIDGIVFSFALRKTTTVNEEEKEMQYEYLTMNVRKGHRVCIRELQVRYLNTLQNRSSEEGRPPPSAPTTRVGIAILPVMHTVEPHTLQSPNVQKPPQPMSAQDIHQKDRTSWASHWRHYATEKLTSFISYYTDVKGSNSTALQHTLRYTRHFPQVPVIDVAKDGLVLNSQLRPTLKHVKIWKETHIPLEAPLCSITSLKQQAFLSMHLSLPYGANASPLHQ